MTLDLTVAPADVSSTYRRQVAGYTGPASYLTGGDVLTPNDFRMGKIFAVLGGVAWNGTLSYLLVFDPVNTKLVWVDMAGAQVANGTDLSGYTARLEVLGQ